MPDTDNPLATIDFHGQAALQLQAGDGARATVLLHGAQLVSWVPAGGDEQLYLSPRAVFDGVQAVRGGVPVIFPQFNERGTLPRHGFARRLAWRPVSLEQGADDALAVLRLVEDAGTLALWPRRFVAELSLRVSGARLDIELAVEHPGDTSPDEPLQFTAALHTYLRVADLPSCRLDGLHRLRYEDCLRRTQQVDVAPSLQVDAAIDRIYFDAARPLQLRDGARHVELAQQGFSDVVVWNPGADACAGMADMPPEGWREMLCVEAASIGTPVALAAGEVWIGRQSLSLSSPAGSPGKD